MILLSFKHTINQLKFVLKMFIFKISVLKNIYAERIATYVLYVIYLIEKLSCV